MHKQSYKWSHAQADLQVATRRHVQKMKNEALWPAIIKINKGKIDKLTNK